VSPTEITIVEFAPRWSVIGLVLLAALALGTLAVRAGTAPALRRGQRWFHVASVSGWMLGAWLLGLRLLASPSLAESLARAVLLGLLGVAAVPIVRDMLAGLALALEGRVGIGDDVRVAPHEGRVVRFGLRSLMLRERDGTEISLPYRKLLAGELVRLNLGSQDSPCQFEVAVPDDADLEDCSRRLFEAAILSAYAAPGRRPEVFTVADAEGGVRLRIRAYVFDRAYEQHYRGDVLARAFEQPPQP
jgi:small-conductance mechanosensitive channel